MDTDTCTAAHTCSPPLSSATSKHQAPSTTRTAAPPPTGAHALKTRKSCCSTNLLVRMLIFGAPGLIGSAIVGKDSWLDDWRMKVPRRGKASTMMDQRSPPTQSTNAVPKEGRPSEESSPKGGTAERAVPKPETAQTLLRGVLLRDSVFLCAI